MFKMPKLKIIELEEPKAKLERFLSFSDKRPNFIKRNIYNALGWNGMAVRYSPNFEKGIIEKDTMFGGDMMYVDPIFEKQVEIYELETKHPYINYATILEKLWKPNWIALMNSITNDGEIGYAQQGATETPAANEDFFDTTSREQLANPAAQNTPAAADVWSNFDNPATAAIAGSNKIFDAAYPKRNDGDADNTGAGVDIVSFLTSYTTGDFNDGGTTIKNFAIQEQPTPVAGTKLLTHGTVTAFNKTATDTLKFFINHEMRRV